VSDLELVTSLPVHGWASGTGAVLCGDPKWTVIGTHPTCPRCVEIEAKKKEAARAAEEGT
jgi:hypothetical protein